VVGIVGKSKSLDFPTMLIFWSLVRNSVVLAVYLLFSVACFLTVHEHCFTIILYHSNYRLSIIFGIFHSKKATRTLLFAAVHLLSIQKPLRLYLIFPFHHTTPHL
ncbi:MAG: hypothetical protein J6S14_06595, partial [Clostridia bacterium]|nr:hypothetical protein [Clostridia bacterium]